VLGNPGWDPLCFADEPGFRYYFSAMVRLALQSTPNEDYIDQFLFHLTINVNCMSFNTEQAAFVRKVLEYLLEIKAEEIESHLDADQLLNAIEMWQK
jgi:hypothetical protein